MRVEPGWIATWAPTVVAGVCPHCGNKVTFDSPGQGSHDLGDPKHHLWVAVRVCPNRDCLGIVYLEMNSDEIALQFPPVRRSLPRIDLPASVSQPLDEAITCQAHSCHVASAMLVRRTIEAMCQDRGAQGEKLWNRIEDLKKRVVLPSELFEAMHDVRLLGNDAAHITSKEFDQVGPAEVDAAIALVEQLLMAVYGYGTLLDKLRNLKKPS